MIAAQELPDVAGTDRPSRDEVPERCRYAHLVQELLVVRDKRRWEVRDDFVVGRSLLRKAGRGVYCLSHRRVEADERLLPYWRPGAKTINRGFDAKSDLYFYGDGEHGYLSMAGAEEEGFIAGLTNDNATFDHALCNCYIGWDPESRMYWIQAARGWKAGQVCELYIFYGVSYWVWNAKFLTQEKREQFHRMHEDAIQKVIDSENAVYVNPFTGRETPKTGERPTVAWGRDRVRVFSSAAPVVGRKRGRPQNARREAIVERARLSDGRLL